MRSNPFFDAANAIVATYEDRIQYMNPKRTVRELPRATLALEHLADAARYAGRTKTSDAIAEAAKYWEHYGKKPALFTEDTTA
ncbi:Uncharacterised protein [Serratia ficaria]|uniref:hypothetical protein n=1 Tax=Serratia ficaria TaxID=61651 RepID=UPI002182C9B5|nr:hypothetical protein [Serratia ficaria]CAI2533339.1 Uncharacterised protein [Serratia ficaria]